VTEQLRHQPVTEMRSLRVELGLPASAEQEANDCVDWVYCGVINDVSTCIRLMLDLQRVVSCYVYAVMSCLCEKLTAVRRLQQGFDFEQLTASPAFIVAVYLYVIRT